MTGRNRLILWLAVTGLACFLAVILTPFIAAIMRSAQREFPCDVGVRTGNVIRDTFDIGDFIAKLAQMPRSFPKFSLENIVIGYPAMNEEPGTIVLGDLDPSDWNVHGGVSRSFRRNFELPWFYVGFVRIGESFRYTIRTGKGFPIYYTLAIYSWRNACVPPRYNHGQSHDLLSRKPFDDWSLASKRNQSTLHGLHIFPINRVRFDHLGKLPGIDVGKSYSNDEKQQIQNYLRPINAVPPFRFWLVVIGILIALLGFGVCLRSGGPGSALAAFFGVLCVLVGAILALWSI
jgi:hypothetical protein